MVDERRCQINEEIQRDHENRIKILEKSMVKMQVNMEQLPKIHERLELIDKHIQELNTTDILMQDRRHQQDKNQEKTQKKLMIVIAFVGGFWTVVKLIEMFSAWS